MNKEREFMKVKLFEMEQQMKALLVANKEVSPNIFYPLFAISFIFIVSLYSFKQNDNMKNMPFKKS